MSVDNRENKKMSNVVNEKKQKNQKKLRTPKSKTQIIIFQKKLRKYSLLFWEIYLVLNYN